MVDSDVKIKYYPQTLLQEYKYMIKKMENLIMINLIMNLLMN